MGMEPQGLPEAFNGVLVYTSPPLERDLAVIGPITATLYAASSAVDTDFTVKLCDVWPDGRSTLIARGWLNGTRRASHANPEPMRPGEPYELEIPLRVISYVVPGGHRLRLSISSSDFPTVWPTRPRPAGPIRSGCRTSLSFKPGKAGFIWPPFSISTAEKLSAGP